jgi:hypothetical protein
MSSKRIEIIRQELERIRLLHGGRLTPEAVVRAAKKAKNPLHREFDWNDARAAHRGRLDTARDLITTYVTVTVVHRSQKVTSPMYVRDPTALTKEQGYVAVTSESLNRTHALKIVMAELDRCQSAVERARSITLVLDAKFPGLSEQLEDLLHGIIEVKTVLRAAE